MTFGAQRGAFDRQHEHRGSRLERKPDEGGGKERRIHLSNRSPDPFPADPIAEEKTFLTAAKQLDRKVGKEDVGQ